MSFSFARMRSRRVFRWSWKDPWRDLPQMKVKPKNAKVSGLPSPRRACGRPPQSGRTQSGGSCPGEATAQIPRAFRALHQGNDVRRPHATEWTAVPAMRPAGRLFMRLRSPRVSASNDPSPPLAKFCRHLNRCLLRDTPPFGVRAVLTASPVRRVPTRTFSAQACVSGPRSYGPDPQTRSRTRPRTSCAPSVARALQFSSRSTHQLSSKARVRYQCSSALPSGQPSRSHSA